MLLIVFEFLKIMELRNCLLFVNRDNKSLDLLLNSFSHLIQGSTPVYRILYSFRLELELEKKLIGPEMLMLHLLNQRLS